MLYPNLSTEELEEELMDRIRDWFSGGQLPLHHHRNTIKIQGENKMKIVETSLNLRIERGKCKDNYLISEYIAKKQLSISDTDIYSNVEFMDCDNTA